MQRSSRYWLLLLFAIGLPSQLISQSSGSRMIGGKLNLEHLKYNESSLGAIRDFDVGFSLNYLKILSQGYYQHNYQSNTDSTNRRKHPSFGLGLHAGITGYYNNTDSIVMHSTELFFGPIVRYYTAIDIFFEGSLNAHYTWNRIGYPESQTNQYYFIPSSNTLSLSFEAGIGYRIILSRNISLEPIIAYQRTWSSLIMGEEKKSYPYQKVHSLNIYLSLQFYL